MSKAFMKKYVHKPLTYACASIVTLVVGGGIIGGSFYILMEESRMIKEEERNKIDGIQTYFDGYDSIELPEELRNERFSISIEDFDNDGDLDVLVEKNLWKKQE